MFNFYAADSQRHRFDEEEVAAFHRAGQNTAYAKGDVILRRGDEGDSMFVLLEGEVEVFTENSEGLLTLGPGCYFGELSFINPDHRRSTTIVARTACKLCVLDQGSAEELFRTCPQALFTLLRRSCAFLVDKEEGLIKNLKRKNRELEQTLDFLRRTREERDVQEVLAQTDPLTGLYNRRCLTEQLDRCTNHAQATGEKLALVLLDLDQFKPINDKFGHPTGDEVLQLVGKIMREGVRRSDLPCRLGGDEFAIVLPNVDAHIAATRAESIRRQIESMPPVVAAEATPVTASLGGTMYVSPETPETFLKRADDELYRAKMRGKNCLSWA